MKENYRGKKREIGLTEEVKTGAESHMKDVTKGQMRGREEEKTVMVRE